METEHVLYVQALQRALQMALESVPSLRPSWRC